MASIVSFKCTACGKCCNSAPLMSVPELFHHQNRFVGGLAIRRIQRPACGETPLTTAAPARLSPEDSVQWAEIADTTLFSTGRAQDLSHDFAVMTQALDYESLGRCPALLDDNRCAIQQDRKPAICSMVPFDALYPDGMQGTVLLNRKLEENCIVGGRQDGYPVVVRGRRIESDEYNRALAQRREDLRLEKHWWGNAVFAMLKNELFCNPTQSARIPTDGLFSLSIVPVLVVLAGYSAKCRDRCLHYIDSQIALIDRKIDQAIARKSTLDKPVTREFRSFRTAYLNLRPYLLTVRHDTCRSPQDLDRDNELEKYLGL